MARGKKKGSALTPEEKLAQALVPVEEQPYQVPENWCWTTLRCLVDTYKEKTEDFSDPDVKYVGLEHLEKDTGIIGSTSAEGVKSLKNVFHPGQILYGKLRPYLNKHDVADFDGVCSTDILVFNVRKTAIAQYVDFFLNQRSFIEYAVANSKGINLPRVSEGTVLDAVCPLPPLAEQQRIVDRIEYLFAKLDEAKENAQSVLDSFETRKAAILHKAFTGELTARWRAAHSLDIASWKNLYLKDICDYMKAGGDKPVDFVDEQDDVHCIPVVANGISNEGIIGYSAESKYDGETVTVSGRGTIGYSIYRNYSYYPVVRLIVLGPKKDVYAKFLKYAFDAFPEEGTGSSIPQLTVPMIKEKVIPVPCIEEQAEIVRIIDSLFAKEQQAKEAAEAVLEKIDLLKKSILARAFRGELGTNDPTEESALELLKEILKGDI